MNLEFDKEIKSKFKNNVIEYGIVNGIILLYLLKQAKTDPYMVIIISI